MKGLHIRPFTWVQCPRGEGVVTGSSLQDLYQAIILDHYRHPRRRGNLPDPAMHTSIDNPLCGDEVELDVLIEGGVIQDIAFQGRGCSISMASASIMAETVSGKSIADARALAGVIKEVVHRGDFEVEGLGDAEALQLVQGRPPRFKCALLAWDGLLKALRQAEGGS